MKCQLCQRDSPLISQAIGYCVDCIRSHFAEVAQDIKEIHIRNRLMDYLPPEPPRAPEGRSCKICAHECRIPPGGKGYCGLYQNLDGKLIPITSSHLMGIVHWYYDGLPTNCCAAWVCPGCSNTGYPQFSYATGPEYGYKNLAVFYGACNFDCLFCQNWTYRRDLKHPVPSAVGDLVRAVDKKTSCICFFGGDPTPQVIHALRASRMALKENKGRVLRICWETNGGVSPPLMEQMARVSLTSGGCIKVDLKAWSEEVNIALCGVSNRRTLENFRRLAAFHKERRNPPFLIASTLLVPGYVDQQEVGNIARFIASLDPSIPYTLLAFHPDFRMWDLPPTSREHATQSLKIAQEEGLKNVHLGNVHLLW
ncbi:MAG: radical SAM protein [Deltaproteobacteria bacterium]|nr:MAG: radical SAM protein [Deltaproteobacteria bacterium]